MLVPVGRKIFVGERSSIPRINETQHLESDTTLQRHGKAIGISIKVSKGVGSTSITIGQLQVLNELLHQQKRLKRLQEGMLLT